MVIWKYVLIPGKSIDLPVFSEILSAREQGQDVCVWASVNESESRPGFRVSAFATGQEPPFGARFIGTASLLDGAFILHVFAEKLT